MKKLLISILICAASASATTTVTGTLQNLGTNNVAGGFVRFWLRGCAGNQPRIDGTSLIAPTLGGVFYFDMPTNSMGVISGTLYSNRDVTGLLGGDIECGGSTTATWYGMQAYIGGKAGPEVPILAKNTATFDISNITPITTNPVSTPPTGDSTYARLDGGNQPFSGNVEISNHGGDAYLELFGSGSGHTSTNTLTTNVAAGNGDTELIATESGGNFQYCNGTLDACPLKVLSTPSGMTAGDDPILDIGDITGGAQVNNDHGDAQLAVHATNGTLTSTIRLKGVISDGYAESQYSCDQSNCAHRFFSSGALLAMVETGPSIHGTPVGAVTSNQFCFGPNQCISGGTFSNIPSCGSSNTGSMFLRSDAPDLSHLVYVCQGSSWTPITIP